MTLIDENDSRLPDKISLPDNDGECNKEGKDDGKDKEGKDKDECKNLAIDIRNTKNNCEKNTESLRNKLHTTQKNLEDEIAKTKNNCDETENNLGVQINGVDERLTEDIRRLKARLENEIKKIKENREGSSEISKNTCNEEIEHLNQSLQELENKYKTLDGLGDRLKDFEGFDTRLNELEKNDYKTLQEQLKKMNTQLKAVFDETINYEWETI